MPEGRLAVEMDSAAGAGAEFTVMVYEALALWPALSLTCSVKLEVEAVVGVPVMVPELLSESPAGRLPEDRFHE